MNIYPAFIRIEDINETPSKFFCLYKQCVNLVSRALEIPRMSNSPNIKFAIVGTGLIGPRHADAVINVEGAELTCIVDPHPSALAVAERFGCPLFESVQAMLKDPRPRPDAALVCTPNHTHVTVSKELLQAGIHVLCEKPISVDAASGTELVILPMPNVFGVES